MQIKYFATLRDITHTPEETISVNSLTLDELIHILCKKYGKAFEKWVTFEEGGFGSLSIFLVNGQDYRSLNGLQTQIKDGDVISLFPPIAGG
ncbi:MAG: MoaD/ThiS family protein [Chloroflexi bacterium]|jgi:molybdopterin synthase sulfur carrier subunit|nr:MoaD/ThiS family protein [Chloroflexota bacterium]BCY18180.1 molybdopterin synthase sulfur carrier subunit [Leptolinea sp. HRD-7]